MTMTANKESQSQSHYAPPVTIVNTNSVKKILLSDGWHTVKGSAEIVPYSVGSSPQTDYRTAIKFTDGQTGEEMVIDKRACLGFVGGFSSSQQGQNR